jgi:hypothetical protein
MSERIVGLPYSVKSDYMIEFLVPRKLNSSHGSNQTFRDLIVLLDDVTQGDIEKMKKHGFVLQTMQHDVTGNEMGNMDNSTWGNLLESLKNPKHNLADEDLATFRTEIELRRGFLGQKRNPFWVNTPVIVKSVEREKRSALASTFGCKQVSGVRTFLPFELLLFLTEFCGEMQRLISQAEKVVHNQYELQKRLEETRMDINAFRAKGERVSTEEEARLCYLEISLSIAKSQHTHLGDQISKGFRTVTDSLNKLKSDGVFRNKDSETNFTEFLKHIGYEKTDNRQTNTFGGAFNFNAVKPSSNQLHDTLKEVIKVVQYFYKLNHWGTFHVLKDISRSLTFSSLDTLRSQSTKFNAMYKPKTKRHDSRIPTDFRIPEVLTAPDVIALVRQFDSKLCRILSGKENDMNAYFSTGRNIKGHYQLQRTAPAALTSNRNESLSDELLKVADKRVKVGIALFDSFSNSIEMKSVSNIVIHPRTTATEGVFLTPAKVVSLFYMDFSMMTTVDYEEADIFLQKTKLTSGEESVRFMAAIQQFNNSLLRYDLDTSQASIDEFNSGKLVERRPGSKPDMFDVFRTPHSCGESNSSRMEVQDDTTPKAHLMFVPVLQSILTFMEKHDEFDLFIDPLCANSYVLGPDACYAVVAIDSCGHAMHVFDPTSSTDEGQRRRRLLAIVIVMLSMSVKFRKPYAASASSTFNSFSNFYTVPIYSSTKAKKAWFEELSQLAEQIIRDYQRCQPPMLYHNKSPFSAQDVVAVPYKYEIPGIGADKKPTIKTEVELVDVARPIMSIVLSCKYARYFVDNWAPPSYKNPDLIAPLSPDGFIQRERNSFGSGGENVYMADAIKKVCGAVFRVPKIYVPTHFGKTGNNKNNSKGQGNNQGRNNNQGRGNNNRGRGNNNRGRGNNNRGRGNGP